MNESLMLEIAALAEETGVPLTESEFESLEEMGRGELREILSSYEAIVETEFESEPEAEIEDDYDFYEYDDGYWEVEVVWDVDTE